MSQITRHGVRTAQDLIKPLINRTPVLVSENLSHMASSPELNINFYFKCENLQKSGSFKFRGASNFIAEQPSEKLKKGVVAVSTGNFGHAVALAAKTAAQKRNMTIDATVVLPKTSAPSKIEGAKKNGGKVVLAGANPEDRDKTAKKIIKDTGAIFIGPMDDPSIVHGQATTTMEMIEQVHEMSGQRLDAVVLPSATGGLLTGAAVVCKGTETSVYGCEPQEGGPDLQSGIESGVLSNPKNQNSVADGLRASTSKGNFDLIRQKDLVAGLYTATEREIKKTWRLLMEELKLVIEPSSAVSVALLLFNAEFRAMLAKQRKNWNIGIVLTGGNTTVSRITEELGDFQPRSIASEKDWSEMYERSA
ncbi:tryptophan synthase beta subunit-like PLP-dependent enzyme [Mollisia scopiformis]|uniref:Tryptophan synthase beta subunit-like PLP-dependent enzyme n=1 Tax=Mollisia scopiformis TaxID=149040 RepID=A0A194XAG9_MOLSC|nr:tryptophan synthase beta subunit-like PLP-dependent enzyme [Mollisia scopiformis]KUJ16757.1 tryptophan synthase beta subunit-like PLP-dependent enzyme [Mollisia scopiformis]